MKVLFCNIGWMEKYEGLRGDRIRGGGSYVDKNQRGVEVCNFSRDGNFVYGYVQRSHGEIDIDKIGTHRRSGSISGVTLIWTAPHPDGGTVVVGYYKNATVFRKYQKFSRSPPAQRRNGIDGYWIKAPADQSKLFSVDERNCKIPRRIRGGMRQNPVWYADEAESKDKSETKDIIERVLKFIRSEPLRTHARSTRKTIQNQERKARIEVAAIQSCSRYYERLGYIVKSVEKDNIGWDLEATLEKIKLRIEVKGLSGWNFSVELTPNEYKAFSEESDSYRLAVVLRALDEPKLCICRYSKEWRKWVVEGQKIKSLDIKPRKSAQIYCLFT